MQNCGIRKGGMGHEFAIELLLVGIIVLNHPDMSCADTETFIWRAGYYGPSSKTPFQWRFAGGPILADISRGVLL